MTHPAQSIFAAALLLSLAFGVEDGSNAPPASGAALDINLACDETPDLQKFGTAGSSVPVPARCGGKRNR